MNGNNLLDATRTLVFWALLLIGGLCIVGNYYGTFRAWTTKASFSQVPIVGGLLSAVAWSMSPWPTIREYWWLPLLVDMTVPMLASVLLVLAGQWVKNRFKRR